MNTLSRRSLLQGASALALSGLLPAPAPAAGPRPNLLFLLSDDHQFRALGAAGNREISTPCLDALAAGGTYFTHCYVNDPICTPSRAALLTGQYGFTNGVTFFNQDIKAEAPRLPRVLKEQGYTTAFTGKWHNDGRPLQHGFDRMRHVFLGGMHEYDSIPVVQGLDDERATVARHPTELFAEAAQEFIRELPEPWCLFVWFTEPHDPRTAPGHFAMQYAPESLPLPKNFLPEPPEHHRSTLEIRDEKLLPRPLDPAAIRRETAQYYGMISHLDAQIATILAALEERGQRGRTLIAFGGDNGLTIGAHGLLGKQTLYEEGVRVPLMFSGPGIAPGRRVDTLVNLMDVMPTLCEAAGAQVPTAVEAHSLLAKATGAESPASQPDEAAVFGHYEDLFRMVRQGPWKLVHALKAGHVELFNLADDPYELHNLAEAPEHTARVEQLAEALQAWRRSMGDAA